MSFKHTCTLLLLSIFIACKQEHHATTNTTYKNPKTEFNISYGSDAQQVYDLYLPANRSADTTKTIVIIHGGGWTSGDKHDVSGLVGLVQRALPNHAVVNLNYRLANGTNRKAFPDQINDIAQAITQLVRDKESLGINGTFALYGISAGAHIAALYAFTQNSDNRVKAIINMVGPVDFTDPYYLHTPDYQLVLHSLIDYSAYPAGFNASETLSPARQVTSNSPPTISFYGNADPLVPASQLPRLDAAFAANQVVHRSTVYDGGHGNWNGAQYTDLQAQVAAFMAAHY